MRVQEALNMKPGAKVWIDYTPNKGHGNRVNCVGRIDLVDKTVKRNAYNVDYVFITVSYMGIQSTFPSFCLAKL